MLQIFQKKEYKIQMYLVDTLGFEAHMRHMREKRGEKIQEAWYKRPYFYPLYVPRKKIKTHGQNILIPSFVKKADYEFEIAARFDEAVQTSDIKKAIEFVKTKMHFAIFNDVSARDFQAEDMLCSLSVSASKGICDKAFGNWALAKDLKFDENGIPFLIMRLFFNGGIRCHNVFHSIYFKDPETRKMKCWGFPQVIAWFGKMNQGFKKGDILGSGTIGDGSIAELTPLYPWLKDGDKIVMEAGRLGILENTVHIFEMNEHNKDSL